LPSVEVNGKVPSTLACLLQRTVVSYRSCKTHRAEFVVVEWSALCGVEISFVAQVAEVSDSYYIRASEGVARQSVVGDDCTAEQDAVLGAVEGFECLRLQQSAFRECSSTFLVVVFYVSD